MFFSHFAMQSNYLFQWMKPSLKVMIFLQQIDKRISCKAGSQERYQPPQNPPQETTMQKSRVSCKLQEEVDSVCQGTVQEKSG